MRVSVIIIRTIAPFIEAYRFHNSMSYLITGSGRFHIQDEAGCFDQAKNPMSYLIARKRTLPLSTFYFRLSTFDFL
jgi:hypothetical protein